MGDRGRVDMYHYALCFGFGGRLRMKPAGP